SFRSQNNPRCCSHPAPQLSCRALSMLRREKSKVLISALLIALLLELSSRVSVEPWSISWSPWQNPPAIATAGDVGALAVVLKDAERSAHRRHLRPRRR